LRVDGGGTERLAPSLPPADEGGALPPESDFAPARSLLLALPEPVESGFEVGDPDAPDCADGRVDAGPLDFASDLTSDLDVAALAAAEDAPAVAELAALGLLAAEVVVADGVE